MFPLYLTPPLSAPQGPFTSGGGYSSEAINFAASLAAAGSAANATPAAGLQPAGAPVLSAVQHGDGYNPEFVAGLDEPTQRLLSALFSPGGLRVGPSLPAARRRPGSALNASRTLVARRPRPPPTTLAQPEPSSQGDQTHA